MIRNLRVLGLTLVAALALAAVWASSAFAFEDFINGEKNMAAFRGVQNESAEFKLAGGTVICTVGVIRGMFTPEKQTFLETSDSAEGGKGVEYSGCTYQGKAATFNSNHCNYKFEAQLQTLSIIKNGTVGEETECKEKGMSFLAGECLIRIKQEAKNEGRAKVGYTPEEKTKMANEWFVFFAPSVVKLAYTSSGGCLSNGTFENGEYLRGTLEVKGYTGTKFALRSALTMK